MVNEETIRVGDNPDRVRGLDYGMITVIRLLWGGHRRTPHGRICDWVFV